MAAFSGPGPGDDGARRVLERYLAAFEQSDRGKTLAMFDSGGLATGFVAWRPSGRVEVFIASFWSAGATR
jgi:hypothetical protein